MAVTENPLATDGIPGLLTPEYASAALESPELLAKSSRFVTSGLVRRPWAGGRADGTGFFKLADDAPEEGKGGGGGASGMGDMDEKKPVRRCSADSSDRGRARTSRKTTRPRPRCEPRRR